MKLADWIAREGRTRTEIARCLDISGGHLTDLCNGRTWPGRDLAQRIVDLTCGEVGPADFLASDRPAA